MFRLFQQKFKEETTIADSNVVMHLPDNAADIFPRCQPGEGPTILLCVCNSHSLLPADVILLDGCGGGQSLLMLGQDYEVKNFKIHAQMQPLCLGYVRYQHLTQYRRKSLHFRGTTFQGFFSINQEGQVLKIKMSFIALLQDIGFLRPTMT